MTHHSELFLDRRGVLRGLGAGLLLPWLESVPGARIRASGPPARLIVLYMPNGALPAGWNPREVEHGFEPGPTFAPLAEWKSEILIPTGLRNASALEGEGHYVKTASFLTGARIRRTEGRDLGNAVSFDQVLASTLGRTTFLPSLELGIDPTRRLVDMGYSTVYGGHISWTTPRTPAPKILDPRALFDRLTRARSLAVHRGGRSILDLVAEDSRRLSRRVSRADGDRLLAYETSVRTLEERLVRFESSTTPNFGARPLDAPPSDFGEHVGLLFDLITLALQSDATRIVTMMLGNAVSNRNFSFLEGVTGGHHDLSHHENNPEKAEMYRKINEYHLGLLRSLLQRLASVSESGIPLKDSTMVVFGSGLKDGNSHDPNDLPIVIAGGKRFLRIGQHSKFPRGSKLCGLWLALMHAFGVEAKRFGDADSVLPGVLR